LIIKIKKTTQPKDILDMFFNEDIHSGFVPDRSMTKKAFKSFLSAPQAHKFLFYKIFCDSSCAGLCVLMKMSQGLIMAHLGILKKFRGMIALLIANKLKSMIFSKLNYKTIVAPIKKTNLLAINFVRKLGFSKKFDLNDQEIWGVSYYG